MSVQIQNITKIYGNKKAVDNITFQAKKGSVTGFLGPNGAGKTTTMKILSCFIKADEGKALVCGLDTQTQAREVKRLIGYLPEHNPLYKDMYVKEYLNFVAGMHGLSNRSAKVIDMIERTGLGREQHQKIGALSKGYRQRVGLAQAMIHNPKVLILDEPTSGLDPNQLADIRKLIMEQAKEKTVILSTHIMQEVEAMCEQVVIINRGEIVADDTLQQLRERVIGKGVQVTIGFDKAVDMPVVFKNDAILSCKKGNKPFQWEITTTKDCDIRPTLFQFAVDNQLVILEMSRHEYEVEDVFRLIVNG